MSPLIGYGFVSAASADFLYWELEHTTSPEASMVAGGTHLTRVPIKSTKPRFPEECTPLGQDSRATSFSEAAAAMARRNSSGDALYFSVLTIVFFVLFLVIYYAYFPLLRPDFLLVEVQPD